MKKVDTKGLAPSTVKRVKSAYNLGLSNGKALASIKHGKIVDTIVKTTQARIASMTTQRDNALEKCGVYLTELGRAQEAAHDPHRYLLRCQTITNTTDGRTGQCLLVDKHEGDHAYLPAKADPCIACNDDPSGLNDPCVVCGKSAKGVNQYERDGTPPSVDNEPGDCAP